MQVEHGITEMVSGLDLVEMQLELQVPGLKARRSNLHCGLTFHASCLLTDLSRVMLLWRPCASSDVDAPRSVEPTSPFIASHAVKCGTRGHPELGSELGWWRSRRT